MRPEQCTYCKNYPCDLAKMIEEGVKFQRFNHAEQRWVNVDTKDIKCVKVYEKDMM